MNSPLIFITESNRFSPRAVSQLSSAARVELADVHDRGDLLKNIGAADVLWVRLRNQIDREVMDAAPRLRAIATPTTGLNHVDTGYAQSRGIEVISLRGETEFLRNIHATGEHTLALILALVRHVPSAARHVTDGGWDRDVFRGRELHGKTAGIVGFGRVGGMVADYLRAFGMRILVTDPILRDAPGREVEMTSLEDLLQQADLVTLHVSLTEQTRGFFGHREFSLMKNDAWFINTSRGELIEEAALFNALESGKIAGAALDVLCDEHSSGMQDHPLVAYARTRENLLITPHIGGCTLESMEQTEEFLAGKVVCFLESSAEHASAGTSQRKDHA